MFLQGKKVLITRERKQAEKLGNLILGHGGLPIMVPLISFEKPNEPQKKDFFDKIEKMNDYDWLVFTSKNGVDFFFKLLLEFGEQSVKLPKVAVIGSKTNKALIDHGEEASFIPPSYVAESFLPSFLEVVQKGERVLILKGDLARDYIYRGLLEARIKAEEAIVYRNQMPENSSEKLAEVLKNENIEIILFTSPSTVDNFMMTVKQYQLEDFIQKKVIVTIGPVTKARAEQAGLSVTISPEQFTIDHMIKDLAVFYTKKEEQS